MARSSGVLTVLRIRREQVLHLQNARRVRLQRHLVREVERRASATPRVLPEALAFAARVRLDAPEHADSTARAIVLRYVERSRDPDFARALEHVLCQMRPLVDRLAFIDKHLMPHRPSDA